MFFDLDIINDIKNSQKIDFSKAFEMQKILLSDIIDGKRKETIWFLEHESVFTAGRSALESDFLGNSESFSHQEMGENALGNSKIEEKSGNAFGDAKESKAADQFLKQNFPQIVKTNRGGKFTYHGPGQLIVYIFLNLKNIFFSSSGPDLQKFVTMLELWVLNSLMALGVKNLSLKPEVNHGIWIERKKISAIGINIQKWVTSHGISINIDPDMKFFEKIIPCGVSGYGVTSLKKEGYDQISTNNVIESMVKNFSSIFKNYKI